MSLPSHRRTAWVQLHLAVGLAGGAGLFAKLLPVSPLVLTAGRTVFGSLALLIAARLLGTPAWIADPRARALALGSGAVLALHWFSFFAAIATSSVAIGLLAFASFPLFVAVLEPLSGGPRPTRHQWFTCALVVAGLALLTPRLSFDEGATRGLAWGLLSALTYAALALMSRRSVASLPAITVALHQQAMAALVCGAALALIEPTALATLDLRSAAGLLLLGVVFTALGQSLVVSSLRVLPAQTVSVLFGLEPLYAIGLAWWLLGEQPTWRIAAGGTLVLVAVTRAALGSQRQLTDEQHRPGGRPGG